MICPQLPKQAQQQSLQLTPRLYGTKQLYEKLYQNTELDEDFQKIDQENKKELLAIRDRDAAEGKLSSTINLKSANCGEKLAYYNKVLQNTRTTAFQLNQLGIDKDIYYSKRVRGGTENNERLMK